MKLKKRLPGVDAQYVLCKLPRRKAGSTRPMILLTDTKAHPGEAPETRELTKAHAWNDSSGPRHYLRRHPKLRRHWYPLRLTIALPRELLMRKAV